MGTVAWIVGTVVVIAVIVLGLPWFSNRMTAGGGTAGAGGNALNALDQVFNPGAARGNHSLAQDKQKKGSAARGEGEDDEAE